MTLLLAFFVVMYAVSVVNEGKYRVASESMLEAFNGSARVVAPLAPERLSPRTNGAPITAPIILPVPGWPTQVQQGKQDGQRHADLRHLEDQVRKAFQSLVDQGLIVLRRSPDGLGIEIRTDILFPSGVAQLSFSAESVLRSLASILAPYDNPLRVEGFTDNVPIATTVYPSNWELSAARAATVARLFSGHGVDPMRLGIVGWGDVRPVADNGTAAGRNQNRRVLVVVKSEHAPDERATEDGWQMDSGIHLTAPLETDKAASAGAVQAAHVPAAPAQGAAGTLAAAVITPVIAPVGHRPAASARPAPPAATGVDMGRDAEPMPLGMANARTPAGR